MQESELGQGVIVQSQVAVQLTDTEIEIIKAEHEHSEVLMSEYASNKSFAGAIAAIGAYIVLEWWRAQESINPVLAIFVIAPIVGSVILFVRMCFSDEFKYPSKAENWIDWRQRRADQLKSGGWTDTSDADLKHEYYERLRIDSAINLSLIYRKQWNGEWAGVLAMAPIVIVLIHAFFEKF